MKRALLVGVALLVTALAAAPGFAKSVRIQSVDLNDRGMSTEGGVATLYRVSTGKTAHCRIEAIHYGETGKTIYGFAFNPRLFSAVRREYRYNQPIYARGSLKQWLASTETLRTKEGRATLPAAFTEYRAFFDARKLANCLRP